MRSLGWAEPNRPGVLEDQTETHTHRRKNVWIHGDGRLQAKAGASQETALPAPWSQTSCLQLWEDTSLRVKMPSLGRSVPVAWANAHRRLSGYPWTNWGLGDLVASQDLRNHLIRSVCRLWFLHSQSKKCHQDPNSQLCELKSLTLAFMTLTSISTIRGKTQNSREWFK